MGSSCLEAKRKNPNKTSLYVQALLKGQVWERKLQNLEIYRKSLSAEDQNNGINIKMTFLPFAFTTRPEIVCYCWLDQPTHITKLHGHACDMEFFPCWEEAEIAVWCICLCPIFQILLGNRRKHLKRKKNPKNNPKAPHNLVVPTSISSCCAVFEWAHGVLSVHLFEGSRNLINVLW